MTGNDKLCPNIEKVKAKRTKRHFTTPIPKRFHFHVGVERVLDFLTADMDVLYNLNKRNKRKNENVDQNKVQRLYEKDDFDIDELIAVDDLTEIHAYVIQLQNIDIDSMTCIFYINKCLSFCKEYLEYRSYNLTTVESKILAKVQEIILNLLLIKDTNISMNASIDVSTLMSSLAHTHHILNLRNYESIV